MAFPKVQGVYVISDGTLCTKPALITRLGMAMRAGAAAVQIRERDLEDADFEELAAAVIRCREDQGAVILNRRPKLVEALDADGVQVGTVTLGYLDRVRSLMPKGKLIGVSCHQEEDLKRAFEEGADFATLSPFFPTPSKPDVSKFVTLEDFLTWQSRYNFPIFPLGGIGMEQAKQLGENGIRRAACIRGVLDVAQEAEVFSRVQQMNQALGVSV